jgi:hypothetical protein
VAMTLPTGSYWLVLLALAVVYVVKEVRAARRVEPDEDNVVELDNARHRRA